MGEGMAILYQRKPSELLDAPINERTALRFYWFGDIDSHFRNPIDFYAVPAADRRLHSVDFSSPDTVSTFITAAEMKNLIETLKSRNLNWFDSHGREDFSRDWRHRGGDGFLDITFVTRDSTTKTHIRIARMCDELAKFDSVMATPRILWQFQTFRWDNGCVVPNYDNSARPPE